MKFVVTGALGHIGSQLIRDLPQMFPGCDILMIDNLATQRYCSLFNLPDGATYRFSEGDVLTQDLALLLKEADVLIHLAAITDAVGSFHRREEVEANNYDTTVRIAEACLQSDCPLIYISTTSVYGTQADKVDENCLAEELVPQSPYAETKLKEERYLEGMGNASGLAFVICRFGTIVGASPGMRFHTAVNKFCWQAATGIPITVWKTAMHQKRPYLDLEDAIAAYRFIITNQIFDRRVYNVLTVNLTVSDIITSIKKFIPVVQIQYGESQIMNHLSYEVSSDRIREKGFDPSGDIDRSIGEVIGRLRKLQL